MANLILKMTKRSRNGACSRKFHLVPNGLGAARTAICGARPNIGTRKPDGSIAGARGWGSTVGSKVTCSKCAGRA